MSLTYPSFSMSEVPLIYCSNFFVLSFNYLILSKVKQTLSGPDKDLSSIIVFYHKY